MTGASPTSRRGGDETFAYVVEFLAGLVLIDENGFPKSVRVVRGGR